jgi:peroxidase
MKEKKRASKGKSPKRRGFLRLEQLEARCLMSAGPVRPIDEVGNNAANPNWGAAPADQAGGAAIQLLRLSPVAYADGLKAPSLPGNPSARLISNIVNSQSDAAGNDIQTVDQASLSDFAYTFGQFMDHDMDLTPGGTEAFNIPVPAGDPIGPDPLPFGRSLFDPTTGTTDLSQVYGSSQVVSDALRTFSGGLMKMSPGGLLPYDNTTYFTTAQIVALNMANDAMAVPESQLFAAGDVRANENIELTVLQTLFVRNHNLLASELQQEHPGWSDEQIFQEARKINIAQYQNIVFNGWIPAVLGPNALPTYTGYDPTANASISTEFSTVGFRFGHSLLSNEIQRQDNNGQSINVPGGAPINLAIDFFDPNLLTANGAPDPLTGLTSTNIGPVLKGDADGDSQAMDVSAINEVRNLLFANGQLVDQDLIARDIQRARDDGIGTYNQVREAYGLSPITSFSQITSNTVVQGELAAAYGTVDNIDPFEGGLAEDHLPGSDVGPLFQAIMVDQFKRLRNGDSFFYLNENFNRDEIGLFMQGSSLAQIIEANTQVRNLQSDVFKFQASISGEVSQGRQGAAGLTVLLEDTSGNILATTTTNSWGHYSFNQLSGPASNPENASGVSATGQYDVVLLLPPGFKQTSLSRGPITISRGGTNVRDVDFNLQFAQTGWQAGLRNSSSPWMKWDTNGEIWQ